MFTDDENELDQLEYDLPEEVVIEDVTEPEETAPEVKTEEEDDKESYSKRVQKRLDKLVYERNVERELRAKEAQEFKQEQAALRAEQEAFKAEIEELKSHRQKEVEEQSNQELEQKRKDLIQRKKDALEIGDYDEVTTIDDDLMEIKLQLRQPKPEPVPKQTPQVQVQQPVNVPEYVEPPVANIPEAQANWEANNQWVYDANHKARLDKANKIFEELKADGWDADDPDTFVQLDKKLKRETPPPAGAPDRGQVIGTNSKTGFTTDDRKKMSDWGLDPDNPLHRKEWIKNRK